MIKITRFISSLGSGFRSGPGAVWARPLTTRHEPAVLRVHSNLLLYQSKKAWDPGDAHVSVADKMMMAVVVDRHFA